MTAAAETATNTNLHFTSYNREHCEIGLVHIGYGAFHRAHQSVYIDDYMDQTGDLRWGIAAVNLRPSEQSSFAASANIPDGYLLKTTTPSGIKDYRLVRCHCRFEDWSLDADAAENLFTLDNVSIASVTVTESGYYLNDDHSLNLDDPSIRDEISGGDRKTIYGFLANVLQKRMQSNGKPLTVLCCDNIRANGKMLERNIMIYLKAIGADALCEWVKANVTFPCSMVDRITPRATDELRNEIASEFPQQDLDPIHGEAFSQWVIENKFAGPVPDLAKVGVEIVDDVDPYEETKIRILNGGHTALCYLGALAGYQTFDKTMFDADLRAIFDAFETQEVLPGLTVKTPFDKGEYLAEIAERFSNAAIADQLARICMDGFSKMPIYIRPTIESCLVQGIAPKHTYLCVASWVVYARRWRDGKMPIEYNEPYWSTLEPLLTLGKEEEFARSKQLWGDLADQYTSFVPGLINAIEEMETKWPA